MSKRERSSLENDEYIVEKILKRRTVNGQREALVKWKDYSSKFNTWEPIDNIRTFLNANKSKRAKTSTVENYESDDDSNDNEEEQTDIENEKDKENVEETIVKKPRVIKHIRSKSKEKNLVKQNKIRFLFDRKINIKQLEPVDISETSKQFDHEPPEVEKIIGKRIRPGNSIEYLIKFKGLSSKHNIWEPSENKDIQLKIAEYEANLVKEKVKAFMTKIEPIDSEMESKKFENNNNSLSEVITETKMKKVNFEIFENDKSYLLVKGENNFIQLDKSSNKNVISRAVLNLINVKE